MEHYEREPFGRDKPKSERRLPKKRRRRNQRLRRWRANEARRRKGGA